MKMNIKRWGRVLLAVLLMMPFTSSIAASFSQNVDAINQAAQSVLMLEVLDANNNIIANGSGFVAFNNRTLLTNEHVIDGADIIIGTSDDGDQYLVTKVVTADSDKDVAILEFFSPTNLEPLTLNSTAEVKRGESIVVIGSPLGLKNLVSIGNISAKLMDADVHYIQFTAPISPGSSGGPVFNDNGEVVGITSATLHEGQNINIAVDIMEVDALFKSHEMNQRIKLSEYSSTKARSTTTNIPQITPSPTINTAKVTKVPQPTATTHPLEGSNNYYEAVKDFDYSKLKSYYGFYYNEFDRAWGYFAVANVDDDLMIAFSLFGDKTLNDLPKVYVKSSRRRDLFVDSVEVAVRNKVYEFSYLRFYGGEGDNFFYLGSVGKEMLTDFSKAKNASIRLTMKNGDRITTKLVGDEYANIAAWSRNSIRNRVFDVFTNSALEWADFNHNARIIE